jgi:hypothetical protein
MTMADDAAVRAAVREVKRRGVLADPGAESTSLTVHAGLLGSVVATRLFGDPSVVAAALTDQYVLVVALMLVIDVVLSFVERAAPLRRHWRGLAYAVSLVRYTLMIGMFSLLATAAADAIGGVDALSYTAIVVMAALFAVVLFTPQHPSLGILFAPAAT